MTAQHSPFLAAIVVAGAIALGGYVALDAARVALVPINPVAAANLPGSTKAQVVAYSGMLDQPDKMPSDALAIKAARQRLVDEPLDANALNLMAYIADPEGRSAKAAKYASVATDVSPRVTFSQLVMSFATLQSGDVPKAMRHFDAILRARPDSAPLFFTRLQQALDQPELRSSLAELLADGSPWVLSFLSEASNNQIAAGNVARIMLGAGDRVSPGIWQAYGGQFVTRSFEAGEYALAKQLVRYIPGGTAAMFSSISLDRRTLDTRYGAAAWNLNSGATGSASVVEESPTERSLSFYAAGDSNDALAGKYLTLPSGSWRISQNLTKSGDTTGTEAYWRMTCLGKGEIWRSNNLLANSASRLGSVSIPQNCEAQRLDLVVRVPFGQPAIDLTVRDLAIGLNRQDQTQ